MNIDYGTFHFETFARLLCHSANCLDSTDEDGAIRSSFMSLSEMLGLDP